MGKPFDGQDCSGGFGNVPVAHDASGTAKTSPVAGGATAALLVPDTAFRLNLLAVGSANATVTIKKGSTARSGSITIPVNTQVQIDCAGIGSDPVLGGNPDTIQIVAGAATPVSFWFDCTTDGGV